MEIKNLTKNTIEIEGKFYLPMTIATVELSFKPIFAPDDLPYGIEKVVAYNVRSLPSRKTDTIYIVSESVIPFISKDRIDVFAIKNGKFYRF